MPHLDIISWNSQYFWLVTFFLILYVVLATKYLPALGTIQKIRNKFIDINPSESLLPKESQYRVNIVKGQKILDKTKISQNLALTSNLYAKSSIKLI